MRVSLLLAASLLLGGCRACTDPGAGVIGVDAGAPVTSSEPVTSGAPADTQPAPPASLLEDPPPPGAVRFDCAGVTPAAGPGPCGDARHPIDGLIERAEFLAEVPARHKPPPAPFWAGFAERLSRAEPVEASELEVDERIAAQNAALHLALEAHAVSNLDLARRALSLARRYAFQAGKRPESLEPHPDLDLWLGPRASWVERSRPGAFLHHVIHKNTRVFRLVRTPRGLANFAQLVALDDQGRLFLTRVVSGIEMRLGDGDSAPACVVLSTPRRLRCGQHAGLEVVSDPRDLPQSHFTSGATRTKIGCNGCHGNAPSSNGMALGLADVPKAEIDKTLAARRAEVLETLGRAIKAIDDAR